jgi:hypothetical protein
MGHQPRGKAGKGNPGTTRFLMIVWLASCLAFLTLLRLWTTPAALAFAHLDVDPPEISVMVLAVGTWSSGGLNLLIAVGILAATVLPFALGMKGRAGTRFYACLAVVGLLAVGSTWVGLKRPLSALQVGSAAPR